MRKIVDKLVDGKGEPPNSGMENVKRWVTFTGEQLYMRIDFKEITERRLAFATTLEMMKGCSDPAKCLLKKVT